MRGNLDAKGTKFFSLVIVKVSKAHEFNKIIKHKDVLFMNDSIIIGNILEMHPNGGKKISFSSFRVKRRNPNLFMKW